MAKLDSNAAWQEANRLVTANREVLFAVAGVFVLLPSLALAVLLGEPAVEPGMDQQAMRAAMSDFYAHNWLPLILAAIIQIVGVLTLLTLMRDRRRPTVGQAIASGAAGALSYIAAQFIVGFALGIVGIFLIALAAMVSPVLAGVAVVLLIVALIYVGMRTLLVPAVVAVEGVRNPVTALRRSWLLTAGNFWRILGFVVLLAILFVVVLAIAMLLIGVVLALITSAETGKVIAAVFSSGFAAVGTVYFVAVTAAIHRQLGGTSDAEATGALG